MADRAGAGGGGSYFFRRSTWDVGLMRELADAGREVGYHYEELATLVKARERAPRTRRVR